MKRQVAILLALAASGTGCLDNIMCPGCGNGWSAIGHDANAYDALGHATSSNDTKFWDVPVAHQVEFRRAELDASWHEYGLLGVSWKPDGHSFEVAGNADAFSSNVSLYTPANTTNATLLAWMDAFLIPLFGTASADTIRDAMLANKTGTGEAVTTEQLPNGTFETLKSVTVWTYAARVETPRQPQLLFDSLAANRSWVPRESASVTTGDVAVGEWTFTFGFPTRILQIQNGKEWVFLMANSHGNVTASLLVKERLHHDQATTRISAVLEARGVTGLRPQDWDWEGHLDGGTPDPLGMPRPTPEDVTGPTPVSTPTIAP